MLDTTRRAMARTLEFTANHEIVEANVRQRAVNLPRLARNLPRRSFGPVEKLCIGHLDPEKQGCSASGPSGGDRI